MKATLKQCFPETVVYIAVEDDAGNQLAQTQPLCLADLKYFPTFKGIMPELMRKSVNQLAVDLDLGICETLTLVEPALKELEARAK